jgi:hypothetical protein
MKKQYVCDETAAIEDWQVEHSAMVFKAKND